jgi:hypothetical protein
MDRGKIASVQKGGSKDEIEGPRPSFDLDRFGPRISGKLTRPADWCRQDALEKRSRPAQVQNPTASCQAAAETETRLSGALEAQSKTGARS